MKFFYWEIGYMRSIDIIMDRAGFYETWGCLTFVPSVSAIVRQLLQCCAHQLSVPCTISYSAWHKQQAG